jgi:regulator of nucleoside diphosphate kinase
MNQDRIYVTERDLNRLRQLTNARLSSHQAQTQILAKLEEELDRAEIVDDEHADDFIQMNSRVLLRDLDTGKERTYRLVFPSQCNGEGEELSVLAPLGIALLGYRVGAVLQAATPGGVRRLQVLALLPEQERPRKIA